MKLIGTYFSPFARRVGVALMSRAIPFEHEAVNVYADPARVDLFNPVGKVPILVLDDGEHLIDSAAILDYIDELVGPDQALAPKSGPERRKALRLSAIAATIYEKCTARSSEERRPNGSGLPELIQRFRVQTIGGLKALDAASGPEGAISATSLNLATISAVVAFDYARSTQPDLDLTAIAPALSATATALAVHPAFAGTHP